MVAGGSQLTIEGYEKLFAVMELCYILIVVVVAQQSVHLQRINFTVCKLYLSTPEFSKIVNKTWKLSHDAIISSQHCPRGPGLVQ